MRYEEDGATHCHHTAFEHCDQCCRVLALVSRIRFNRRHPIDVALCCCATFDTVYDCLVCGTTLLVLEL